MTNYPFADLSQIEDIESINFAKEALEKGQSIGLSWTAFARLAATMPGRLCNWTAGNQAGFSSAEKTWLPVHPNHVDINVEAALANPNSIFYTYQKLVALRKEEDWLIDGDFELLETADKVFAYRRSTEEKSYLVVVNLSDLAQPFELELSSKGTIISNTQVAKVLDSKTLRPGMPSVSPLIKDYCEKTDWNGHPIRFVFYERPVLSFHHWPRLARAGLSDTFSFWWWRKSVTVWGTPFSGP